MNGGNLFSFLINFKNEQEIRDKIGLRNTQSFKKQNKQ